MPKQRLGIIPSVRARVTRVLAPLLLWVLVLGPGTLRAEDKKGLEQLQGSWKPVKAILQGQELGALQAVLTIEGQNYNVKSGEEVDRGTLKADATKEPAELDLSGKSGPNEGKTILAIYKFDGPRLVIAYRFDEPTRPTEFASTATNKTLLVTWERQPASP